MPRKKTDEEIFRERQAREGRKGGQTTLKKHGNAHYIKMAKKRWSDKAKKTK